MEITKISSKGQIVIPLKIRNKLGIEEGSTVAGEEVNDLVKQFNNSLADVKAGKIRRVV